MQGKHITSAGVFSWHQTVNAVRLAKCSANVLGRILPAEAVDAVRLNIYNKQPAKQQ